MPMMPKKDGKMPGKMVTKPKNMSGKMPEKDGMSAEDIKRGYRVVR